MNRQKCIKNMQKFVKYVLLFCLHFQKLSSTLLPAATKLGQGNIFTSVCQEFCPQGGGCLPQCMLVYTPPGAETPGTRQTLRTRQTPPRTRQTPPPGADPPGPGRQPPQTRLTPPGPSTPPDQVPPREADCSIRSTSGRYASYWNAFLL